MRALGSLAYYICYHLVRYYAVPLIVVALIVPGFWAWSLPVAALLCAAGVDYAVKKPPLSFIRFCGIYLLEQIAYGAGVFWGCLSRKMFCQLPGCPFPADGADCINTYYQFYSEPHRLPEPSHGGRPLGCAGNGAAFL